MGILLVVEVDNIDFGEQQLLNFFLQDGTVLEFVSHLILLF